MAGTGQRPPRHGTPSAGRAAGGAAGLAGDRQDAAGLVDGGVAVDQFAGAAVDVVGAAAQQNRLQAPSGVPDGTCGDRAGGQRRYSSRRGGREEACSSQVQTGRLADQRCCAAWGLVRSGLPLRHVKRWRVHRNRASGSSPARPYGRGGCRARLPRHWSLPVPAVTSPMPRRASWSRPSASRQVRRSPGEGHRDRGRNAAHCPARPSTRKGTRISFLTGSAKTAPQKASSGPTLARGASADPAGLTARARSEARPEMSAANLCNPAPTRRTDFTSDYYAVCI